MNKAVVEVPWEASPTDSNLLRPGPVGEYIEVVDVDPASNAAYEPVDLNDHFLLAQDGLAPSEGNPQFHQQMVYAVAMRTIDAFERALGRMVFWAAKLNVTSSLNPSTGAAKKLYADFYVPRLRIYPHALRQANAYYSPDKMALLFGYFPEQLPDDGTDQLGPMVFACLSHDIIAHETTHAILDGLHRRYQEDSNVDVLAFHEAFADLVAIFQHFTMPEVLRFEIARTRGALRTGGIMSDLAREFGEALGRSRALRSAIGVDPATINYNLTTEPHERGSILVAAVFAAFLAIYERRLDDLLRLATGGSGVLPDGAIHPDLVGRLANEAAKTARHVLQICIRALDYCPPVDITFMDYLRALITADADLVGVDRYGYRVAFLEAFRARGIYPPELRTLSVESLQWGSPAAQPRGFADALKRMQIAWARSDRREAYIAAKENAAMLHEWLAATGPDGALLNLNEELAVHFGLNRYPGGGTQAEGFDLDEKGRPRFEVHSVRPARRVSPSDEIKTDVIVVITQRRRVRIDPAVPVDRDNPATYFYFRGGVTLVIDAAKEDDPIRYAVLKSMWSERRLEKQWKYHGDRQGMSLHSLYFEGGEPQPKAPGAASGAPEEETKRDREPFAILHIGQ
jgi:hypothetical protein